MRTCASASRELAEPLAGTAATARTWLLIEQPGPWGAKALTSSHLDPALGRALETAADGSGVRVALIRRPGRHPDGHEPVRRRVLLAHTAPGNSWIRTTVLTMDGTGGPGPSALLGLDFTALGAGEHGDIWDPYLGAPLAFVCTNAKRDRCCALLGRPLAAELVAGLGPGSEHRIWEITHIGGHRFAPTLLVLPHGYAYGRATAHATKDVLEAIGDGRIVTHGCRGRSTWDRAGQAADLAVREMIGEWRADAVDVIATRPRTAAPGTGWTVTLAHHDGRVWEADVDRGEAEPPRPESCGAEAGTPARMDTVALRNITGTDNAV
ncbi:sucrase ferredoxin [Streptomyces meridianus]|uniref:Sucrase ferredoxin n=1 Tax=Streptomyces meridianus TaxID=2938945 RepID=A0ABT0X8I3_9ACTN|nr:sucrase ferredoxin [Streptomyces meridianus]MCM2578836.1 sucrase ferredoxin [Streptomyces meridianus]